MRTKVCDTLGWISVALLVVFYLATLFSKDATVVVGTGLAFSASLMITTVVTGLHRH